MSKPPGPIPIPSRSDSLVRFGASRRSRSDAAPEITVVVAAERDRTRLAFALDSLAEQTLDPACFEVIVVDDGDLCRDLVAPRGLSLGLFAAPGTGLSARRDLGWQSASAPLVAFLDEDCRASPGWLAALCLAAAATDCDGGPAESALRGETEPDPAEVHLLYGAARSSGANLAAGRSLLGRLGGYDELRRYDGPNLSQVDDAILWSAVRVESPSAAVRAAASPPFDSARGETSFEPADAAFALAAAALVIAPRSRSLAALASYPYLRGRLDKRLRNPNPLAPIGVFRLAADLAVEGVLDGVATAARIGARGRRRDEDTARRGADND